MEKLLSVCLIARDEAPNVVACLDSVREAADECLVVDTGSTDDTPRLAAAAGARIFHRPWDDDFSAARNFALKKARGRFAFFIDADERLPAVDAPKLRKAAGLPGLEAGRVIIDNVDQGGQVMGRHRLIRLLRRGPGIRFQGRIHETPVGYIKPPVDLDVRLIHTGYDPEAAGRKYERNRRLLDLELADDPASARLHWLAAQT
ncbi:MAG: glycosyltransferase family 2 protein, partial [Proteobacteria bacterium]|nr:glycosyltransferase family 2 protein [Pseudomonadota bacterium]